MLHCRVIDHGDREFIFFNCFRQFLLSRSNENKLYYYKEVYACNK